MPANWDHELNIDNPDVHNLVKVVHELRREVEALAERIEYLSRAMSLPLPPRDNNGSR